MTIESRTSPPWYYGWNVVVTCFFIALFGWGLGFYGPGAYLPALQAANGWSVGLIGTATTLYYLGSAGLIVSLPRLMRRFGPRGVVVIGCLAMATSVLAMPELRHPWQLYADYALMAIGWSAMSSAAITTILAPWFVRRRGMAISIAFNGASCGGVFIVPAIVFLTGRFSFAVAVSLMVVLMLAVLLPLVGGIMRYAAPGELGLFPDGDAHPRAEAAAPARGAAAGWSQAYLTRSAAFWGIAAPFAMALLAQVGFLIHQIAFLSPTLGPEGAGLAVSFTTTAAVAGRLSLGVVVDRLDTRRVTAATFLLQVAALLGMLAAPSSPAVLYAGCTAFGVSVGNVITLPALIVQREYPQAAFGPVVALSTAVAQVTFAFGPGLVGIVRDASGSYGAALVLCAALDAMAALVILWGRKTPAAIR